MTLQINLFGAARMTFPLIRGGQTDRLRAAAFYREAATLSGLSPKPVDVTGWVWVAGGGDDLDGPHHRCPLARASAAFADAGTARPPDGDFIFSGSLAEAIERAQAAAGGRRVHVMGGAGLIRQAWAAGLVDELTIIIAPVTLGGCR